MNTFYKSLLGESSQEWADAALTFSKLTKSAKLLDKNLLAPSMLAAIGAGVVTGVAHLENRPRKATGKSVMESMLGKAVEGQKTEPEKGLYKKIKHRSTEFAHGLAQAFREHPYKSSLLIGTALGAPFGLAAGKRLGAQNIPKPK